MGGAGAPPGGEKASPGVVLSVGAVEVGVGVVVLKGMVLKRNEVLEWR